MFRKFDVSKDRILNCNDTNYFGYEIDWSLFNSSNEYGQSI